MSKPKIRILSNLARVGGTLVSKCLGAMDNTVLLSEIHPLARQKYDPTTQARDWYQLFQQDEIDGELSFIEAIQCIDKRCSDKGSSLVIRDWAHLDYIGVPFFKQPVYRLQLNEQLAPDFEIIHFSLVRHPVDQWLSTSQLQLMQDNLDLETFLYGYRRYAEQIVEHGFMRYEDFTREPAPQMQRLCRYLEIEFDPDFINRWQDNKRISGDADVTKTSRGSKIDEIRPLERTQISPTLMNKFQDNTDYQHLIDLLGYCHL